MILSANYPLLRAHTLSHGTFSSCPSLGTGFAKGKLGSRGGIMPCILCLARVHNPSISHCNQNLRRRHLLIFISSTLFPTLSASAKTKAKNPYDEKRLLEQNRRRQRENNVPEDFPNFVREGFEVKVLTSDNYVKRDTGLIYWDIEAGKGDCPKAGQQVTFHYIGYNESGRRIDSTYLQGSPAKIRMGTNALVPGFEEGIKDMRPGGRRRIIIPPELGPPVSSANLRSFSYNCRTFHIFQRKAI